MKRILIFVAGVACVLAAASRPAAEERRERIVYSTRRPAALDLYLFDAQPLPKQIAFGPSHNYDAMFSPDGRWIVFASDRSGNPHLYAIDVRHPDLPKALTHGDFMDAAPAFAPDGVTLFFVSDRDGQADLFTMPFRPDDPDRAAQARNLTRNSAGDFRPAVSPNGKMVAFSSDRDREALYPFEAEIYLMSTDGSGPQRLTKLKAMSGSPAWSVDGRSLFFYSDGDGERGDFRIWVMNSDGTQPRPLTPKGMKALSPSVMPGGRIAFITKGPMGSTVMSMTADGADLRPDRGTEQACRHLTFDRHSGRMVCAGERPLATISVQPEERPVVAAGAHQEVRLSDRVLDVQGIHALFCSISPDGRELVTGQYLDGVKRDMHLVINRFDDSAGRELFRAAPGMPLWATSWARREDLIAFTVGPQFAADEAIVDIWTIHSDGTGAVNLTAGKFRNNAFPDLMADGSQLVFRSTRDGDKDIYMMYSDGTNPRRVTRDPSTIDTMPTISASGDAIAFSRDYQIFVQRMRNGRPDGAPRLLDESSPSVHLRFSPDGKWIAFASMRAWLNDEGPLSNEEGQPYGEIFVAATDGKSGPIRLTHNRWEDSVPCWGVMPQP